MVKWLELFGLNANDLPAVGTNENDEAISICFVDIDGEKVIKWTTYQDNGWVRINYYWNDGTVEEMYEH